MDEKEYLKQSSQLGNLGRPQVAILDFGSQYSHLIARRVRELRVYCELYSCLVTAEELGAHDLTAVILSGGPSSVYEEGAPHVSQDIWDLLAARNIPVLGICYGMQELAHTYGGRVAPGQKREFGKAMVSRVEGCDCGLFAGMPAEFQVWMSHADKLHELPEGFKYVGEFRLVWSGLIWFWIGLLVCAASTGAALRPALAPPSRDCVFASVLIKHCPSSSHHFLCLPHSAHHTIFICAKTEQIK